MGLGCEVAVPFVTSQTHYTHNLHHTNFIKYEAEGSGVLRDRLENFALVLEQLVKNGILKNFKEKNNRLYKVL